MEYQQTDNAKVINKAIDPEHTSTYYQSIIVGDVTTLIPQTTYYPTTYYLLIEVNGSSGFMEVSNEDYNKIPIGTIVSVYYAQNRLSKRHISF